MRERQPKPPEWMDEVEHYPHPAYIALVTVLALVVLGLAYEGIYLLFFGGPG